MWLLNSIIIYKNLDFKNIAHVENICWWGQTWWGHSLIIRIKFTQLPMHRCRYRTQLSKQKLLGTYVYFMNVGMDYFLYTTTYFIAGLKASNVMFTFLLSF